MNSILINIVIIDTMWYQIYISVNFIVHQIKKIRGLVCIKKVPFNRIDKELSDGKICYTKCNEL